MDQDAFRGDKGRFVTYQVCGTVQCAVENGVTKKLIDKDVSRGNISVSLLSEH